MNEYGIKGVVITKNLFVDFELNLINVSLKKQDIFVNEIIKNGAV